MTVPLLGSIWTQGAEMATSIAPKEIFVGIIGFSWATFLWEEYLAYRQRCVVQSTKLVPPELQGVVDRETFDKARAYAIDKSSFSLVESIYSQVLSTGIMVYGGLPWLWEASGKVVEAIGYDPGSSEILQTVAFVCIGNVVTTVIGLPWCAYFTFRVEQKHGFNKQTPGFFVKDKLKKLLLSQVISAPVVSGLVYIIKAGATTFSFTCGSSQCLLIFFMTIYPDLIAPLFDKYEPLPEGDLKSSIEKLAARINFPLTKLYVVEGSQRSAHSNAYFYGFFKNKRIVLYDTLLQDYTPLNTKKQQQDEGDQEPKKTGCNTTEVLAVLGHELGHWKLNHVLKGIVISQVNLLLIFGVFGSLSKYEPLYRAFGFSTLPAFIGLIIVMQFVFAPYNEVVLALLGSAFALPTIQYTAEVAAERARFMQLFNAQAAAAAAAPDDPTEGARYQQASTRSQYTPQTQAYQYSPQPSNQYNAPQTHQYVPQYQNIIPGAPLKWTGPVAATVPAGVDGRITPVSDTAEVAAARAAFLNTYNAALTGTRSLAPAQTYSPAPQQIWSPAPQTYSAAPQPYPKWTGPVAATIPAGLPGAGYQVAQTADVAAATAAFTQAYSAVVAATTGRRY